MTRMPGAGQELAHPQASARVVSGKRSPGAGRWVVVAALVVSWLAGASALGAENTAAAGKIKLIEYYLSSAKVLAVRSSDNERAKELLSDAEDMYRQSKDAMASGDLGQAEASAAHSLSTISAALAAASGAKPEEAAQAKRNSALVQEIESYRKSFNDALPSKGPGAAGLLDSARLDAMLAEAEQLTQNGSHIQAGKLLREAQQMTIGALTRLRNNETVVYALEFRTPADEFRYEQERNRSYRLMVDQLREQGKAEGGTGKLVDRFVGEEARLRGEAEEQAERGEFESAIDTMEQANKQLIRALQMMGLPIPG